MTSEEGKSSSQGLARVDRDDPVDLQPVRLQDAVGGISIPPAPTAIFSTSHNTGTVINAFGDIYYENSRPDSERPDYLDFHIDHAVRARFDYGDRAACTEGTRSNVFEAIEAWNDSGPALFWLNGSAGTGKSTIAYTMAKKFKQAGILGASFFCSRDDATCSDLKLIFPTIAHQLAQFHHDFGQRLAHIVRKEPEIVQSDIAYQLQKLIVAPLEDMKNAAPHCVVVIDALDECRDNSTVSVILRALSSHVEKLTRLKVFLTSRPEHNINLAFDNTVLQESSSHLVLHEIELSTVEADITTYLSAQLELVRKQYRIEDSWPSTSDVDSISQRSCGLFIFAATSIKFIADRNYDDPRGQLARLLSNTMPSMEVSDPRHRLDQLYLQVLTDAHPKPSPTLARRLRILTGTIVLLMDLLPLSGLQQLLNHAQGNAFETHSIRQTLMRLHSILMVPEDEDKVIRTLHPSFFDFLVDPKRCTSSLFLIDVADQHAIILVTCLRAMQGLKRNICDIPDTMDYNGEISDLSSRIAQSMPPEIQYACRHWCTHLKHAAISEETLELLNQFSSQHMLFWIEACSLLGDLRNQLIGLDIAQRVLAKHVTPGSAALILFNDCERLIREFFPVIATSWAHLYNSALLFSPQESELRRCYSSHLPRIKVMNSHAKWDACSRIMEGHSSRVHSVAFSPDGIRVASGSVDNTICLWDAVSGAHLSTLEGHTGSVKSIAFSPDGALIVSGSGDQSVRVWDVISAKLWRLLEGHSSQVSAVAYSPDGTHIASGGDSYIYLWDALSGARLFTYKVLPNSVYALAFSPNSADLVAGYSTGDIDIWNILTGRRSRNLNGHSALIYSVAYSPDGTRIASGSEDNTIRLWDTNTRKQCKILKGHTDKVYSVVFSPDGTIIVSSAADVSIRLWDASSGAHLRYFEGYIDVSYSLAFSPDGTRLASGSIDGSCRIWNLHLGVPRKSGGMPFSLAMQALSSSSTVKSFLRRRGGKRYRDIKAASIRGAFLSISPDATIFASDLPGESAVVLWDAATGTILNYLKGGSHWARAVVFSHSGTRIATASTRTIRLWDTDSGRMLGIFRGHKKEVSSLVFSLDDTRIACISYDGTVYLWDTITGVNLKTLPTALGETSTVAFSPNGTRIAVAAFDSNIVILWDTTSAKDSVKMVTYTIGVDEDHWVVTMAFSPDGRYLILSLGGILKLLDIICGEVVKVIPWNWNSPALWMPFSAEHEDLGIDETRRLWAGAAETNIKSYYFLQDGWVWLACPRRRLCWVPLECRGEFISSQSRIAFKTSKRGAVVIDFSDVLQTDSEGISIAIEGEMAVHNV